MRTVAPRVALSLRHARTMHTMSSAEIRTRFLQFFAREGHAIVPSASLVPPDNDASLLFTNAGMVPFKQLFLGHETRPYARATSAQRCVRAGGKHNDLDAVGRTRRHHTQFEMLGNFSFGDYFKEDAIAYAWHFLTRELELPADRLHVTVLASDHEARALWKKVAGLHDADIRNCGEDDNFWAMGDTGPCGPCSEIFWDLGDHIADPDERYLELWNLVFMQFSRAEGDAAGTLHALPTQSVDTGMGLERVASVLQRVPSNYHTDAFVPILREVARVLDANCSVKKNRTFADVLAEELDPLNPQFGASAQIQTLRIIADHLRAAYAMLSDGIFPSNVGRGYVLRRILRRAIRFAQNVGSVHAPFLTQIIVPEYIHANGFVQMRAIVANEERAFQEMLLHGTRALDKVFASAATRATLTVVGSDAFRLYDTHGIPLDITQVLAEEKGLVVDTTGFEKAMDAHRRKAVESHAFSSLRQAVVSDVGDSGDHALISDVATTFTGYDTQREDNTRVLSVWPGPKNTFWVSLASCPFYAEGGGQVGDRGHLYFRVEDGDETVAVTVQDTKRLPNDAIALHCVLPQGMSFEDLQTLLISPKTTVDAAVDAPFRNGCQVHHSATHLLQTALKCVLGDHVSQAGSFVTTDRLRFDFAHFGALSLDELTRVERLVNDLALQRLRVSTAQLPRAEAEASGAICNFGEKYGDTVRVVTIGDRISSEFCGGTHVDDSLSIFPFVLVSEGSVAAGTRRIEAVAGVDGAKHLQAKDAMLQQLATQLETTPAKVPERIIKMQKQIKQFEQATQALGDVLASLPVLPVVSTPRLDVHVIPTASQPSEAFAKVLRRRAEVLLHKEPHKSHVVLIGTQLVCISNERHAGQLLQHVVKRVRGRGGGSATFAQGSVPSDIDVETLSALFTTAAAASPE